MKKQRLYTIILTLILITTPTNTPLLAQTNGAEIRQKTTADLRNFYATHGGKNGFPAHQVTAIETLVHSQDDITAGDWGKAMPLTDNRPC